MNLPSGQSPQSDLDLINRIKENNDSEAVKELVHRHTGIYINVIQKYEGYSDFRKRANIPDLKDDKFINIYQWALKYDPERPTHSGRPMQFGSYVGEMTKFMCKGLVGKKSNETVEFVEEDTVSNEESVTDTAERDSDIENVREQVAGIDEGLLDVIAAKQAQANTLLREITDLEAELFDKQLFKQMFNMRYGGKKPMTWRAVAEKTGLTHEGARKLFNRYLEMVKAGVRE